jgi:predicted RecA/RadA family phage recombinase
MTSGATVFNGDVISITPTATAGHYAKLTINGVNYGRLESEDMTLVIAGETTIETEAVDLVEKTVTLDVGAGTTLTAAQTRLAGMLVDLTTPANVVSGGTVYVGDTVEFTAATTQGTGYHVTLTIDTELADLDENGKVSVEVADDITAVSASVTDGGGE